MQIKRMSIAKFLPKPEYKANIEVHNAVNEDIRDILEKDFLIGVKQCAGLVPMFKEDTPIKTACKIWLFERNHCTYVRDSNLNQKIRLPAFFARNGHIGDCKTLALFARCVYAACYPNYETAFCYANYRGGKNPSHVYAVVKDGAGNKIIIDGCWFHFNSEKNYNFVLPLKFKSMRVVTLSGTADGKPDIDKLLDRLNNASPKQRERIKKVLSLRRRFCEAELKKNRVNGFHDNEYGEVMKGIADEVNSCEGAKAIGKLSPEQKAAKKKKRQEKIKKAKAGAKKFWSKLGKGFLFINLLPIRAAFNAIVAMNVNSLAHNMRYVYQNRDNKDAKLNTGKEWKKIEKVWGNVGGLKKALLKAIELGAKHKPLFLSKKAKARFNERKKTTKGYAGIDDINDGLEAIWIGDLEGLGIGNPAIIAAAVAAASGIIAAILPAVLSALKKGGKDKEAAQVAEQGQEIVDESKSNPNAMERAAEDVPIPGESMSDYLNGLDDGIHADWSALSTALGEVAKVGIEAGAKAVARKASKKPKLKKLLDTANEQTENLGVGMCLRKSGFTDTAKSFVTSLKSNTGLLIAGGVGLTAILGFLAFRKK